MEIGMIGLAKFLSNFLILFLSTKDLEGQKWMRALQIFTLSKTNTGGKGSIFHFIDFFFFFFFARLIAPHLHLYLQDILKFTFVIFVYVVFP